MLPVPIEPKLFLRIVGRENDPPTFTFGMDPARSGTNSNVIWLRHNDIVFSGGRWAGVDTYMNAALLTQVIRDWENLGWICMWGCIDIIGMAGVYDTAARRSSRMAHLLKPINVAYKATEPHRYRNVRSEVAWNLRKQFYKFGIKFLSDHHFGGLRDQIQLIPRIMLDKLEQQITTIKYKADERFSGLIILQSKDEYKNAHNQESPDEFDALCLAYNNPLPNGVFPGLEKKSWNKLNIGGDELEGMFGR